MFHKAYGKVNLILKIFPKQKSQSKHQIDSVMQLYWNAFDKINIKKSKAFSVRYLNKFKKEMNIDNCSITRSINFLKSKFTNLNTNFQITVIKNIPIGSGFGGESTDAAYVINYILKKNNLNLTNQDLLDITLKVGSDIPFFISKFKIAHVSGFGEIIKPIQYIPFIIKVYPTNIICSTKNVYMSFDKQKIKSKNNGNDLYLDLLNGIFHNDQIYNDLQCSVFKLYPEIKNHYDLLNRNKNNKILVNGAGGNLIIFE